MGFEEYAASNEAERMKLAVSQLAAVASVQIAVSFDDHKSGGDPATIALADNEPTQLSDDADKNAARQKPSTGPGNARRA